MKEFLDFKGLSWRNPPEIVVRDFETYMRITGYQLQYDIVRLPSDAAAAGTSSQGGDAGSLAGGDGDTLDLLIDLTEDVGGMTIFEVDIVLNSSRDSFSFSLFICLLFWIA